MPRGDKSSYTGKQKRKAEHIEAGYRKEGLGEQEAERRAWATVNAQDGGGKKSGSGRKRAGTGTRSRKKAASRKKSTTRKTGARKKGSSPRKTSSRARA